MTLGPGPTLSCASTQGVCLHAGRGQTDREAVTRGRLSRPARLSKHVTSTANAGCCFILFLVKRFWYMFEVHFAPNLKD